MTDFKTGRAPLLSGVCIAALTITGALADIAPSDEIIVTAQGRQQSVQDVSISIDATPGLELQERVIVDVENFALDVPSVTIAESPFQRSIAIRGVGSTGGNYGYEQSAPFFIDGVFGGRAGQFLTPFFDLDRIEVVKGPQAIFFGKNATAGAVSLNAARPTDDFYASVNGGYEVENGGWLAEGVVSGPLTDNLRGRVAVRGSRRGGYLTDEFTGEDVGVADDFGARIGLEFDASDNLSFYAKYEYAERDSDRRIQLVCNNPAGAPNFPNLDVGFVFPPNLPPFPFQPVTVECAEDNVISSGSLAAPFDEQFPIGGDIGDNDLHNAVLKTELAIADHTVELTTGYSAYNTRQRDGLDRSAAALATSDAGEDFDQFSQEIRVLSPLGGRIEYVAGFLYIDQTHELQQTVAQIVPPAPFGPAPLGDFIDVAQDSRTFSGFAQLTLNITDEVRIKAGARYTNEKKEYVSNVTRTVDIAEIGALDIDNFPATPGNPSFSHDLERTEENLDPSVTVEWNPDDDTLIYATYARGTKSGGFEFFPRTTATIAVPADLLEYEEEEAVNYEVGFKTTVFDGAVVLNGAYFFTNLKGLQNQVVDLNVLGFITLNAEEAHVTGIEMETAATLTDALSFGGAFTWLSEAEYDAFTDPARGVDFTGNRLPYAPEWSGTFHLDGEWPVAGDTTLRARLQGNYTGDRHFDAANVESDLGEGFFTLDARIGVTLPNQFELYVNGRNLMDKDDIRLVSQPTLVGPLPTTAAADPRGVLLAEGRTVFIGLRKEF